MSTQPTEDAYDYVRVIHDTPTSDLLDAFRRQPTQAVQDELVRRGVVLWHHGLRSL